MYVQRNHTDNEYIDKYWALFSCGTCVIMIMIASTPL